MIIGAPITDRTVPTGKFAVLDGWRAISIVLVMAAHMLPLGPKSWQLNVTAASFGMAMFFALSGFLIVQSLLQHANVFEFLVRRLFRILPLAFVYLIFIGLVTGQSVRYWPIHLLFLENYIPLCPSRPDEVAPFTGHFWSLCVEMHFYWLIGAWMGLTRFRGIWIVPGALIAVSVCKAVAGEYGTSMTHWRVDEILAGGTMALIYRDQHMRAVANVVKFLPLLPLLTLLLLSCHPVFVSVGFECLRPYVALCLIGNVVLNADRPLLAPVAGPVARYIAKISFALYVVHIFSMYGWLGSGDTKIIIYMKRPLCFLLSWGVAHLSSFTFEARMMAIGRTIIAARRAGATVRTTQTV